MKIKQAINLINKYAWSENGKLTKNEYIHILEFNKRYNRILWYMSFKNDNRALISINLNNFNDNDNAPQILIDIINDLNK